MRNILWTTGGVPPNGRALALTGLNVTGKLCLLLDEDAPLAVQQASPDRL